MDEIHPKSLNSRFILAIGTTTNCSTRQKWHHNCHVLVSFLLVGHLWTVFSDVLVQELRNSHITEREMLQQLRQMNFLKKTLGFLSFLFRLLLHSYPGADVEAPLLFLKVGLKLSLLMKHIVRAGSGDCESSLSCTAIILGCTERFFFTLHLITGYF